MNLSHYSASPFELDRLRQYNPENDSIKPIGLWVSVEDYGDGWRELCLNEDWGTGGLTHRTDVLLTPDANILYLASPKDIDAFTVTFKRRDRVRHDELRVIDWMAIAQRYQGMIIAPYQWERRLTRHTFWYYGWDCASGCIWDLSAVACVTATSEKFEGITR